MKIKFSIVIPYFNNLEKLSRCLKSISYATNSDAYSIEVVIIDDGSDEQPEIDYYKNLMNIRYFRIPHSGSPIIPRKIGVLISSGTWISFLDSDDQIYQNKFSVIAAIINRLPHLSFLYHKLSINGSKRTIGFKFDDKLSYIDALLKYGNPIPNSSVVIKRNLLTNFYNNNNNNYLNYYPGEDYFMWLNISRKPESCIYFINKTLGIYEQAKGEFNFSPLIAKNSYRKIISAHIPFTSTKIRKLILAAHRYNIGSIFLSHRNFKSARRYFISSFISGNVILKFKSLVKLLLSTIR